VPLCPFVSMGLITSVVTGSSTTSNQAEAGSIIVRHIKANSVPNVLLRVYGPLRSTHNASQGFVMTAWQGISHSYACVVC
jgi:hypothetical protein